MKHKNEINEIYEKMSENFYRTKDYIVVQKIFLQHETFRTIVFSIDYYTKRTKERDKEVEIMIVVKKKLMFELTIEDIECPLTETKEALYYYK